MTIYAEDQHTTFKKKYIRNLIALASTDGNLDWEERILIQTIGLRRGLEEWQVNELLEETIRHQFFVPDSINNRMNLLYDVMQIVYADGKVTKSEVAFVRNVINALQLEANVVNDLLDLFQTHTPTPFEWNDFLEATVEDERKKFQTIL